MIRSFIWSLLGLFLMGLSFPKMWLTERKWPEPTPAHLKKQQPEKSWTHNCKDDFTDDLEHGDREFWGKSLGFVIIAQSVALLLAVIF